jgi:hypothetical protein
METLTIKYINSKTYTNITSTSSLFYVKNDNPDDNKLWMYNMVLQQLNYFDANTRINLLNPISNLYKYHMNESLCNKSIYDAYILSINNYVNCLKSKYPDGTFEFSIEIKDANGEFIV